MEEWPSLQECTLATAKLHFLKGKQFLYCIKQVRGSENLPSLKGTVDEVKQIKILVDRYNLCEPYSANLCKINTVSTKLSPTSKLLYRSMYQFYPVPPILPLLLEAALNIHISKRRIIPAVFALSMMSFLLRGFLFFFLCFSTLVFHKRDQR